MRSVVTITLIVISYLIGLSSDIRGSDGPGKVMYNGSVSSMVWTVDADGDADYEQDIADRDIMLLAATIVDKTEYRGMSVYKDNKPYMLLFRGGYVTFESGVTLHHYTQDYLGNNRAVVNGTTGAIEQLVAYYPFGGVIADLGTGHSLQQYKFGGKELLTVNGLNEYDFGARRYYQAVPMFTQLDPFADKFPWLSPYVYCANNPVNFIDMNGLEPDEYESALMCQYVYQDKDVDNEDILMKLNGRKWDLSHFKTSITMNRTKWYENGLESMLFERTVDGVTEYAYVFAGTNSVEDIAEDILQLGGIAPQYYSMISNAKVLSNDLEGSELTFLGHSLGGGGAAAASMATGRRAITFNPAAVSRNTKLLYKLGSSENITNYKAVGTYVGFGITIGGCFISNLQDNVGMSAPGKNISVPVGIINPFSAHKIEHMVNYFRPK